MASSPHKKIVAQKQMNNFNLIPGLHIHPHTPSERRNVISMREYWPRTSVPGSKFEKKAGISSIVKTKEVTNFICFLNFPDKQQHVASLMERWRIVFVRNQFVLDKVNLKKVSELFISPRQQLLLLITISARFSFLILFMKTDKLGESL